MNRELENSNKAMIFFSSSKYYFLITLSLLTFLEIEPFNDTIRLILFISLLLFSCTFFILNIKKLSKTPLFWIVTAFFGASTISFIIHGDFMQVGFSHIQYLLLFLNASMFISSDDLFDNITTLAKWFTIFGLFLCLFPPLASLIFKHSQFFHSISNPLWQKLINAPYSFPNRYNSILNANHIALVIGVTSIFSLLLIYVEKNIYWIISAATNVICSVFFIIFAYASRGSMAFLLMAFAPFILCTLFQSKNVKHKKISLFIVILGLTVLTILLVLFFINNDFRDIILNKVFRIDNIATACGRDIRHELAIKGALSSPIFGVNLEAYDESIFAVLDGARDPHNMYLDVWLKFGTPCLILFIVIMIYSLVIYFIRLSKATNIKEYISVLFIISLFLGIATQSFVDDCFFGGYYMKGFMLSCLFGIACNKEKIIKEKL